MIPLETIQEAQGVLREHIIRTPLVYSPTLSAMARAEVYLKLENLQKTGSFKIRGATFKLRKRLAEFGPGGVVAASAGNHAQGVALAAREAGLPATLVMPLDSSIGKQEATRAYGGEVVLFGATLTEAMTRARELAAEGRALIHPYDDADIIAGQGTVGLEILEDLPDPDVIFVPVGGGGLVSGIASAVKELRPRTRVVGVQAEACPSAAMSLARGRIVPVAAGKSIADGIAVKETGELPFQILQEAVDDVVLVSEDAIAAAILMLLERKKVLAEGAGAVPLAALFHASPVVRSGSRVVLVVSGGNVDPPLLGRILHQGLFRNGRVTRFAVTIDDVPGALAALLAVVAETRANVLTIAHDRSTRDIPVSASRVELEIETRNFRHIADITHHLQEAGYRVETC